MIDLEPTLRRVLAEDAVTPRTFTIDDVRSGRPAMAVRSSRAVFAFVAAAAAVVLVVVGLVVVGHGGDGRIDRCDDGAHDGRVCRISGGVSPLFPAGFHPGRLLPPFGEFQHF
jgi:hypothetical protein